MHTTFEFLYFKLFVKEADLVERGKNLLELRRIFFYEISERIIAIYEFEEGVVHDEIIKTDLCLLFLSFSLCICLHEIILIGAVPQFLELLPVDEFFALDSYIQRKHVGISAQFECLFNLAHLPLEFIFFKIRNILFYQLFKNFADLL